MTGEAVDGAQGVLADLDVYLLSGVLPGAIDLLLDEAERLTQQPSYALAAIEKLGRAVNERVKAGGSAAEADMALGALLQLAGRIDPRIAAIDSHRLACYRRALIASQTTVVPLTRVLRHAGLLEQFGRTAGVDGHVAECGVAKGLSFLHLCYEQASCQPGWCGEGFAVFDSFEGLSEPGQEDHDFSDLDERERQRVMAMTQAGKFAFDFDVVSRRIWREFPDVEIHRGWIPDVFAGAPDRRYRFVHVDVDLYAPTRAAFDYFCPRLVPGGVIATDDYNWPGGRRAVDEACARHGLTLRTTDTSLAYVIAN